MGTQITPGTYQVNAGSGCYWERQRGFGGTLNDIIDNEFVSGAAQQLLTILASDAGFSSNANCGTWTRISDERLTTTEGLVKSRDDLALAWRAQYQHRTGAEPRVLIKP